MRISLLFVAIAASTHAVRAQGLTLDPNYHDGLQPLAINLSSAGQSCLDRILPSDLHRTLVYAAVVLPDSAGERFRPGLENFLQDVAQHVAPILGHSRDTVVAAEPAATWRGLGAPLQLTWHSGGRLTWFADSTRADTAAAALLGRAVTATLAEGGAFVPDNATPPPDSLVFRFEFDWPKTGADGRVTRPAFRHTALPVFTIDYPTAEPVARTSGAAVPLYPTDARERGYQGWVLLDFMVDSAGHPEVETMHDVWPTGRPRLRGIERMVYESFVNASEDAAKTWQFWPQRIGGCTVRQEVRAPFQYRLERR